LGHQAISPDFRTGAARRGRDHTAVKLIILGAEEHRLTAIAALGDMMRQTRHDHARNPGHASASNSPAAGNCRPTVLSYKLHRNTSSP
jgi:hypothetical protein